MVESPGIPGTARKTRKRVVGVASWTPAWVHPPRGQTPPPRGLWRVAELGMHSVRTVRGGGMRVGRSEVLVKYTVGLHILYHSQALTILTASG